LLGLAGDCSEETDLKGSTSLFSRDKSNSESQIIFASKNGPISIAENAVRGMLREHK
jgi:hypothetical protein